MIFAFRVNIKKLWAKLIYDNLSSIFSFVTFPLTVSNMAAMCCWRGWHLFIEVCRWTFSHKQEILWDVVMKPIYNQSVWICSPFTFVMHLPVNVAPRGRASQSAEPASAQAAPDMAVDYYRNPNDSATTCASVPTQDNPWWQLDLMSIYYITAVSVICDEHCCQEQLDGAEILIGLRNDTDNQRWCQQRQKTTCWRNTSCQFILLFSSSCILFQVCRHLHCWGTVQIWLWVWKNTGTFCSCSPSWRTEEPDRLWGAGVWHCAR